MLLVLRRRFLAASMGSLLAVLLVLLAVFNAVNFVQMEKRLDHTLRQIAENGGNLPHSVKSSPKSAASGSAESHYSTRYFVVSGDGGSELSYRLDNVSTVSTEEAGSYYRAALAAGNAYGFCGGDWAYRYYLTTSDSGSTAVFLYCYPELGSFQTALTTSLLAGLGSYLAVFVLVFLLSKRIVRPFLTSMERQTQFITDASHEIKTPLGVISANNDVMALEYGDSEWTTSTRHQIRRLSNLVSSMICLTRLDEEQPLPAPETFDASSAVLDVLADFEGAARLAGKRFDAQLDSPLPCLGDEAALRQLTAILADNAVKYAPEGAPICVRLFKRRRHRVLEISNPCPAMDRETAARLFDRFYRQDASRKEGGYGIGLSIAKRLADNHRWRLTASLPEAGVIRFSAEF